MKATDLIRLLASRIAESGDLEILVTKAEGGYTRLHENQLRTSMVFRKLGTQSTYLDPQAARAADYEPRDGAPGVLLG